MTASRTAVSNTNELISEIRQTLAALSQQVKALDARLEEVARRSNCDHDVLLQLQSQLDAIRKAQATSADRAWDVTKIVFASSASAFLGATISAVVSRLLGGG